MAEPGDRRRGPIELSEEQSFRVGRLQVRPSALTVETDGKQRTLQPRVMQVLIALAQARPEVVARETLIDRCWGGRIVGDDSVNRCILALRHVAQEFAPQPFTVETIPRVGHRLVAEAENNGTEDRGGRSPALLLPIIGLLGLIAIAALLTFTEGEKGNVAAVRLVASDQASRELAADIVARTGKLPSLMSAPVRLIGVDEQDDRADFLLEVRRRTLPAPRGASLLLKRADGGNLWATDFAADGQSDEDLTQRLVYSAAQLLQCAGEAASAGRIGERVWRLYVSACVELSDSHQDQGKIMEMLGEVVTAAPKFRHGWARYLQAQIYAIYGSDHPADGAFKSALARHLAAAREVDPDMPYVHLAEYALTPPEQFVRRSRLLDRAVARDPNDADIRTLQSGFLQNVGQLNEALLNSSLAVRLDPASPPVRSGHVLALAFAGWLPAALEELERAERIWPGAPSLVQTRYLLDLRFGDPRKALRVLRSGAAETRGSQFQELLLEARIDGSPAKVEQAIDAARIAYEGEPRAIFGYLQTLAEFGRTERIFEVLLRGPQAYPVDHVTDVLFRPNFAQVHANPRFMAVAARLGLLDYWRTTNRWPDLCGSATLPYDCRAVAARISPGGARRERAS